MSDVELTAVRDAHRFDENALEAYMAEHVEGFQGPLTVKQFEGGQSNPTFQLITPAVTYVLRKQPPGELLPSAHQVDREFRVMHALWDTPVPVPKMYCLCEDTSIIGTKFYVMEMIEGRLFTETHLPSLTISTLPGSWRYCMPWTLTRLACPNLAARELITSARLGAGASNTRLQKPSR